MWRGEDVGVVLCILTLSQDVFTVPVPLEAVVREGAHWGKITRCSPGTSRWCPECDRSFYVNMGCRGVNVLVVVAWKAAGICESCVYPPVGVLVLPKYQKHVPDGSATNLWVARCQTLLTR